MHAIRWLCVAGLVAAMGGCGTQPASDIVVERLPDVRPTLPAVPTLPPPPHPVTYGDGSYSIYGLRARSNSTINDEHAVTGYIVEIYAPPECPAEDRCPTPSAPHLWMADTTDEADRMKRIRVVGYADNQAQIDEAVAQAARGRYQPPDPESGLLPIPTDFAVGAKVKVTGRFAYISGTGFSDSGGLLEYRAHETIEGGAAQ